MTYLSRQEEWDRQPAETVRVKPEFFLQGLVHSVIPGLARVSGIYDYGQQTRVAPDLYYGLDPTYVTPVGRVIQFHPRPEFSSNSAAHALAFAPGVIGSADDLTVIWCGYVDNTDNNGIPGFGSLWAMGKDDRGSCGARQRFADNGSRLVSTYKDSMGVSYDAVISLSPAFPTGSYAAVAFRKRAGSGRVDSFFLNGRTRQTATITGGTGLIVSSTIGIVLAGNGESGFSSGSSVANANTGHNRPAAFHVLRGNLADEQIWALLDNPYRVHSRETPSLFWPYDPAMTQGSQAGYYAYGVWGDQLDSQGGYFVDGVGYPFNETGAGYFDGNGGSFAG